MMKKKKERASEFCKLIPNLNIFYDSLFFSGQLFDTRQQKEGHLTKSFTILEPQNPSICKKKSLKKSIERF